MTKLRDNTARVPGALLRFPSYRNFEMMKASGIYLPSNGFSFSRSKF